MTRILCWNITNFSLNKISNPTGGDWEMFWSRDRLRHILNEVFLSNIPDIFVIIEVYNRSGEAMTRGVPQCGNARDAVLLLLNDIRAQTTNQSWYLVPPLSLGLWGRSESIAVYYNGARLQFQGPYVYGPDYSEDLGDASNGPMVRSVPLTDTTRPANNDSSWPDGPQDYPSDWAGALPSRQVSVQGVMGPVMVPENRLAGQCEFHDVQGGRIYFSRSNDWDSFRSPFYTLFSELPPPGQTPPGRSIKLFSVHTSPCNAEHAVAALGNIQELAPAPNEVSVVLGDFNVDPFVDDNLDSYDNLLQAGFTLQLDPRPPPHTGNNVDQSRKPFCMTHLLPSEVATPYGLQGGVAASPVANCYPRFGYMGSSFPELSNVGAIDNVLTKYGGTATGPAANMTVVNTVVGTPYNALGPAPAAVADLTGGLHYASTLKEPIPLPAGVDGPQDDQAHVYPGLRRQAFRLRANFHRIRDVSDHLALVIDV